MLSDQTLRYAEALTAMLLGVDALYHAELRATDLDTVAAGHAIEAGRESLVVLNMARGQRPESFGSYADARQRLGELAAEAATLPEADRRLYYAQFCRATHAFTLWREGRLPFREQIADFPTVPPEPVPVAQIDALRADLRRELSDLGFGGDLAAQCAAWEERHRVPREAVIETLNDYLDRAWERTTAIFDLPAPKSDGMHPVPETGVPYNARCDYLRREVHLNIDPILTGPALEHLAIHECYPGRWTQFKLREVWYDRGEAPADGLLSVVNSASSCVFEGIADCGFRFVEWPDSPDTRIAATLTRQRAAIGAGAAWRSHALGWSPEQVRDWLRGQARESDGLHRCPAARRPDLVLLVGRGGGRPGLGAGRTAGPPGLPALPLRADALARQRRPLLLKQTGSRARRRDQACHGAWPCPLVAAHDHRRRAAPGGLESVAVPIVGTPPDRGAKTR